MVTGSDGFFGKVQDSTVREGTYRENPSLPVTEAKPVTQSENSRRNEEEEVSPS
jgi:hypothetical protein